MPVAIVVTVVIFFARKKVKRELLGPAVVENRIYVEEGVGNQFSK